jgi:hypothetical protein
MRTGSTGGLGRSLKPEPAPSRHLPDTLAARSLRRTTPRVVRNWITPMILVVAVAFLFSTAFYVLDMLFLDSTLAGPARVVDHYLAFRPDLLTDALPALGMTIVAALGIVLTVIAIIVQLSAERYTGVAMMFLRDPVHVAVLSFYIVASLCAVWLSVTLQAEFVPRSLLLLVMVLTSLGLATMLPYFAYTFWFLEPNNIIDRLRITATRIGRQGLASESAPEVERLHGRLLGTLEEITDIANNSIEGRDKIIASDAVDALRDFLIEYVEARPRDERPWYRISRVLAGNPHFITMDDELVRELESRGLWVEWKAMHEYRCVYDEALTSMREINSLVAIDTRCIGELAARRGQLDLVRMVLRFMNAYLRSAIEAGSARTANDVLHEYRALLEELLHLGRDEIACEGVAFLAYYGHYAFEEDFPAVTVTVAYDVAALCQCAHRNGRPGEGCILRKLLNLDNDQPPQGYRQQRSLRGVRRAQTRLAVYYLSVGEEAKARMIAEDMRDMPVSVREAVREDLAEASPPHFWEVVDRGRNLHYLTDSERVHLNVFLGWLRGRVS